MSEIDSNIEIKSVASNISDLIDKGDNQIKLNTKYRQIVFVLISLVYLFSSCDGGIVPQQNKNIQYNFEDSGESRVGLFGSIDYVGRILGAIVMSLLIDIINRQIFLTSCCIIKAIFVFIPACTENYYINLIARLLSGIPQTLLTSYGTIWTDQFGRKKRRSLMLALFQLFALLGILVGYGIGLICDLIIPVPDEIKSYGNEDDPYKNNHKYFYLGWRLAFSIEGMILAILGVLIFFCPKIFFSSTFYLNVDNDKNGDDNIGREKSHKELKAEKEKNGVNGFKLLIKQLPAILCTKLFILVSIGNTVAFFGMRVIQFYADKFMELVLGVDKNVKFIYFIILCVAGPILGVLIIGIVMQKIGGYGSRNGMIFIIILNIIASFISILITLTLNTFISLGAAWIYLFCLAAVTPLQGGVVIASLPKELKGNGYSINMFFLNGLGSFPSSYIFALICDFIRDNYDESNMRYRTTIRVTMFYNFFGLLLIILAGIVRFRIKGDLGSEQKEEFIEENKDENKVDDENKEDKVDEENKEEKIDDNQYKEENQNDNENKNESLNDDDNENKEENKEESINDDENKDENKQEIEEENTQKNEEENNEEL